mgnify:CR=1 FL=1
MPTLPTDYLVDVLRVDLARLGCSRVILLGSAAEMERGGLRTDLARWGFQVLVPPQSERVWIWALERDAGGGLSRAGVHRLGTLLHDGMEHGVEAIVATNSTVADYVRECELAVPIVMPSRRGAVVPIRNVAFDMGGVLFRWDPLAMARRVCDDEEDARLLSGAVFGSTEWAWQDAGAVDEDTVIWTSKLRVPQRLYLAVEELVRHWCEHREPIAGMGELVRDLKGAGYGIYLLSNAGKSFARYEDQLPAYECFDGKVVSCYEHVVKPDVRLYRILLDRFGLNAQECLFVDDVQANVAGARRAGMRAYRFDGDVDALRAILLGP